jgi:NADH:ubiquinone oxidoreductase subunit D
LSQRHPYLYFLHDLVHHFTFYIILFFSRLASSTYTAVEARKGDFGVFLVNNETNCPYHHKIRAPGFVHLQGLNFMSKGHMLADVVTLIGAQNIVFGEVDR